MKRTIFFVSDGTGITAETLGHSLLTQFDQFIFEQVALPYVNTPEKASATILQINACSDEQPIIFSTLVDPEIRQLIKTSKGVLVDFFENCLEPIETALHTKSSHRVGRTHGVLDPIMYTTRIDAVNYALQNDDGANIHHYNEADLIIVGVSRCGKTPTSLYLALQFGVFVANYPFTEDDMTHLQLPAFLKSHRKKLFGLSIDPMRLTAIRSERRPDSRYASLEQCKREVEESNRLFQTERIPNVDVTTRSIEEIATLILQLTGVKRRLF